MSGLHSDSRRGGRLSLGLGAAIAAAFLAAPTAQAAPFVYVTSGYVPGKVFQFDAGAGGLLTPLSPSTVATDQRPTGAAVSPDGRSLYVANSGSYEDGDPGDPDFGDTISQYDIGADGSLSPKNPPAVAAGDLPSDVAVSPDGKSVYVPNSVSEEVLQYDVVPGGKLSLNSAAPAPVDWGEAVAVSPDGRSVYVAAEGNDVFGGDHTVYQYDVGPSGELWPKSPPTIDAGERPNDVAVSPDGKSVYVVNIGVFYLTGNTASIYQFDVGVGGELSPKNPAIVPMGAQANAIAVSPNGESVYVTNARGPGPPGDNVYQFDVGPGGALTPKSPPRVPTFSPADVAVSPDGKSVYVTNLRSRPGGGNTVSQYDVGASGELSPKNPATVVTGPDPARIAVSPAPVPTAKEQCKRGGWKHFGFRNQGQCIRFVRHKAREDCRAEREQIGRQAFREKYGKGERHRRAMRRCVKQTISAG